MNSFSDKDKEIIIKNFYESVNLTTKELEKWLDTDESQSVGIVSGTTRQKKTLHDNNESIGHQSGRRILVILQTSSKDLDDDDYRHMKKVVGYIKRHQVQVPANSDIIHSRWRYSLMNWGHDPLKE